MIYFIITMLILIIHWFADFVVQTDKQAKGKSKNLSDLLNHVISYSAIWAIICNTLICLKILSISFVLFAPITFLLHFITDYFTSRLNSQLWEKGKVHQFFVSIGFDQVLHYAQLFGTFYFLLCL